MVALKKDPMNIGRTLRVNERFGELMREERAFAGRSVRAIARKFKVKRLTLQHWEKGLSSPPAKVFYAIIQSYGRAAVFRAAELDLQIQIERNELHCSRKTDQILLPKPYNLHHGRAKVA